MHRPRSTRARRLCLSVGMSMLLPPAAQAAAFLPGQTADADPPTGEAAPAPAPPPGGITNGNGIRWELAPWRSEGSLTLDLRHLRLQDGRRTTQSFVFGDIDFATYVWQPWFIRLRAGIGLLGGIDSSRDNDGTGRTQDSGGATGRFAVSVFPASRFPFELRGDVSDSRTSGDTLGTQYRSTRVSMSQGWRPEVGNENVQFNVEHSRLDSQTGGTDTLTAMNAVALRQFDDQSLELNATWSENERQETGDRSTLSAVNARHSLHPRNRLRVETMATWNEASIDRVGSSLTSGVRQVSTFANWSPGAGDPLYVADSPLTFAGSARWVTADSGGSDGERSASAFNATLGAQQDLSQSWRLAGSTSVGRFDNGAGIVSTTGAANLSASWVPVAVKLGDWRWAPSGAGSLGVSRGGAAGNRHTEGLQLAHSLSRDLAIDDTQAMSFSVTQSAAALVESPGRQTTRSVAHSASLFWQANGDGRSQSFAGISASDARNYAEENGRFQLVNLQWSQREQFARYVSGAANVTLQATRNDATLVDAFTGERRALRGGWQRFYNASINLENQRVFSVPRLRYTLLASASSQQLEQRAFGDVDAPRERVSKSIENRLDYSIGRLEARLSARAAVVDSRTVVALLARLQRRF
jgi:hypothetical protein